MLMVTISEEALDRLRRASAELGRTVEDLAECAIEEAALDWEKSKGGPIRLLDDREAGQ